MSARSQRLVLLACLVAAASTAPVSAEVTASTATVVPTASPSAAALVEGLAKLRANDAAGAMADFQRAIAADLAAADGHYYLGVAQRRAGELDRALESFRTAKTRADTIGDATFGARARVAIAMTLDRISGRVEDARAAWVEVQGFAEAHPGAIAPELARGRIAAIDQVRELERTYEPVRQRITSRAQGHGARGHHR